MGAKILIVDDEALERKAIRKCLQDHGRGQYEIEEAENGRVAIMKAEDFRPEIIFMDIKMPGINGIEAATEILKQQASVRFIMLSAYDTFEYARRAMKIGIKDYLLKPSTDQEIMNTVHHLMEEIQRDRIKRQEEIALRDQYQRALTVIEEKVINLILAGEEWNSADPPFTQHYIDQLQRPSLVVVVECREKDKSSIGSSLLHSAFSFIYSFFDQQYAKVFQGSRQKHIFPLLIQLNRENRKRDFNKEIKEYGTELIQKCSERYPELVVRMGIGTVYEELDLFANSYQEALFALQAYSPTGKDISFYRQLIYHQAPASSYSYELESRLVEIIVSGLKDEFDDYFKRYFFMLSHHGHQRLKEVEKKLHEFLIVLNRELQRSIPALKFPAVQLKASTLTELQRMVKQALLRLTNRIFHLHFSSQQDRIDVAKKYIDLHYKEQLTLEDVSEFVQLSPPYFSKLFKTRTNRSFIEYVTEVRVNKAKELLVNPDVNVKEICFDVGYKDPNYFSRVFKKVTGLSPSEYKGKLQSDYNQRAHNR
ncbi:response regulator [Lederbergia sp. NSJ-179]|uniref:response regulator n=1 Tax=Lederbergia sp. NSJ-179 TaxID=2931402 RepID=UPI001FD24502|nr:response regulator [Lederbergia sp. NSJ-179]MCJ7840484.1 response regulator [Lederbergia sp. NSJ-179]